VTAQAGPRVILVDADLRRPVLHNIFNISHKGGLTTALVEREMSLLEHLQQTSIEHLRLLPAGAIPPNPSELLGSQRMKELLKELEELADLVIIDSPPVLAVADSSLLATFGSYVILILRAKMTRFEATKLGLKQLHSTQAKVLGIVLNNS